MLRNQLIEILVLSAMLAFAPANFAQSDGATVAAPSATVDADQAIAAAKAAVDKDPKSAQAHFNLALALLKNHQLPEGSEQLRYAMHLDASFAPAADQFEKIWRAGDQLGLDGVGASADNVKDNLGQPDHVVSNPPEMRWQYGSKILYFEDGRLTRWVETRGLKDADLYPRFGLTLRIAPELWECKVCKILPGESVSEFVPPGQSMQRWTEMVRVERHSGVDPRLTASMWADNLQQEVQKSHPEAQFKFLGKTRDSTIFEINFAGTETAAPQHQIGGVFGQAGEIHVALYVTKGQSTITQNQGQSWVDQLQSAQLVKLKAKL